MFVLTNKRYIYFLFFNNRGTFYDQAHKSSVGTQTLGCWPPHNNQHWLNSG